MNGTELQEVPLRQPDVFERTSFLTNEIRKSIAESQRAWNTMEAARCIRDKEMMLQVLIQLEHELDPALILCAALKRQLEK